jgi:hypothetical protein
MKEQHCSSKGWASGRSLENTWSAQTLLTGTIAGASARSIALSERAIVN